MSWDEPLTEAEREALLDEISAGVCRRGLQTPVIFALEMHRPLAFVASQSMIVLAPMLAPLLGIERIENVSRLLRESGSIDRLIERIDRSDPPRAESPTPSI
ncbi:MAG: hypothetical protein H7Z41_03245 [Cytophagales bacterium]|nr:hypothetical protein [Armatimonadota bacterium]